MFKWHTYIPTSCDHSRGEVSRRNLKYLMVLHQLTHKERTFEKVAELRLRLFIMLQLTGRAFRGTWVAQSREHPTLGLGSGSWSHSFVSLTPASGSARTAWSLLVILSLSLSLPLPHSLYLSQNK